MRSRPAPGPAPGRRSRRRGRAARRWATPPARVPAPRRPSRRPRARAGRHRLEQPEPGRGERRRAAVGAPSPGRRRAAAPAGSPACPPRRSASSSGAGAGLAVHRDVRRDGGRPAYLRRSPAAARRSPRRGLDHLDERAAWRVVRIRSRSAIFVPERPAGSLATGLRRRAPGRSLRSRAWAVLASTEPATKMEAAGVDAVAIDTFAHYYRLLEHGETGMIPESTIEPLDMESLADVEVDDDAAAAALRTTAVIKLNGGLGTSMGMDRAKSLLCVRRGCPSSTSSPARCSTCASTYDAPLPLIFMNSFRTSGDTMAALARYDDLPVEGLPLEFLQNKEPKLLVEGPDARPATRKDPDLEWCPPGHGDLYTALRGTGLLQTLHRAGLRAGLRVQLRQPRRRPRRPDRGLVRRHRYAVRDRGGTSYAVGPQGRPLRPPQDRRPDRAARDRADAADKDREALADLDRHRFCSTNNLWFDLEAMSDALDARARHPRPAADPQRQDRRPGRPVHARGRPDRDGHGRGDRGVRGRRSDRGRPRPVRPGEDHQRPAGAALRRLRHRARTSCSTRSPTSCPYVDLDTDFYKLVGDFDRRFPEGAPSLREATSFTVSGDWTFGPRRQGRRRRLPRRRPRPSGSRPVRVSER